jgi:hypothetical protein
MAPVSAGQLEAGQTTIIATLNGSLSVRPIRPGPRPRKPKLRIPLDGRQIPSDGRQIPSDGRRMIGGPNEQAVLRLFADFRRQSGEDEEEDDLAEESDEDYTPRRRYSYPQEYKLAGIEYFQTTWMKLKDETPVRITVGKAARKLKITRKMLRHWVKNKGKILNQKKGSRRAREL